MTTETNRDKLQRFFTAVTTGDIATQRALIHPDFILYEADSLPYAGEFHGADGWVSAFGQIASTWSDIGFENKLLIGEPNGDEFAWYMGLSGCSAKTGKSFKTTVLELWSLRDEKIISIRPHYWDTKMMADLLLP